MRLAAPHGGTRATSPQPAAARELAQQGSRRRTLHATLEHARTPAHAIIADQVPRLGKPSPGAAKVFFPDPPCAQRGSETNA